MTRTTTIQWMRSLLIQAEPDDYVHAVDGVVAHLTDAQLYQHGIETVEDANIRIGNAPFALDLIPAYQLDVWITHTKQVTHARAEFLAELGEEQGPHTYERTLLRTLRQWQAALEHEGLAWSGPDQHTVYVPGIKLTHSQVGIPPTRTTADRMALITEITEITDPIWWPHGRPDQATINDLLDQDR